MADLWFYVVIVLKRTPPWAYGVLVLLLILGARRLRSQTISLWALSITPAVFFTWSVAGAVNFGLNDGGSLAFLLWPASLMVGLASFRLVEPSPLQWIDQHRLIRPGTAGPLLVYLGVFFCRYGLEVWAGFVPQRSLLAHMLGALLSGYMAGRTAGDFWLASRMRPSG